VRVLILGGTVFLGRHVAAEALARGHELTLFTRGLHGDGGFDGQAELLRGDRGTDLSALRGREWDVVVDTSGYEPEHVAASSQALADSAAHLVFVSSCSAYPGWPEFPVDEDSPVWTSEEREYGPLKAACERAAEAAMPGRVASVRAGLITGRWDNVFRVPWWVTRVAAGGEIVAPVGPEQPLQIVDARDLAAWMLDLGERRVAGAFNGTAPAGRNTFGDLIAAAAAATGADARPRWFSDDELLAAGVAPWTGLPLWTPEGGTWAIGTARAQATGLRCRALADTVADIWAWLQEDGETALGDWRAEHRPHGLDAGTEAALLRPPSPPAR
jgi:nucleoside-diphosphate-sugar epimerase